MQLCRILSLAVLGEILLPALWSASGRLFGVTVLRRFHACLAPFISGEHALITRRSIRAEELLHRASGAGYVHTRSVGIPPGDRGREPS